jgi:hypothetical protein
MWKPDPGQAVLDRTGGHLRTTTAAKPSGKDCCDQCLQVSLTRNPAIERLELASSTQQQLSSVVPTSRGEGHPGPLPLESTAPRRISRPHFRSNQQPYRCMGGARIQLGRGRSERTFGSERRV